MSVVLAMLLSHRTALWDEVGYNVFRRNCQYIQYTYIPVVQGVSDYYIPFLFMTKTFKKNGHLHESNGEKGIRECHVHQLFLIFHFDMGPSIKDVEMFVREGDLKFRRCKILEGRH